MVQRLRSLLVVIWSFGLASSAFAAYNCVPDVAPKAALISISAPGPTGDSTVTGAPGAVPGGSFVVLVTLDSGHFASATAAQNGSFSTTLFAPPGTSVLVKAGSPAKLSTPGFFICFPGTIIGAGQPGTDSSGLAVTGAGVTNYDFALPAWTFQGSITTTQYAPGDPLHLTGTLSVVSPALQNAGAMSLGAPVFLEKLSGPDGTGALGQNTFASIFTTPGGFPIEREAVLDYSGAKQFAITKTDSTHASAAIDLSYTMPATLPAGYYRPYVLFNFNGVPEVPVSPPAYNSESNGLFPVTNSFRMVGPSTLLLPIVRVGTPQLPRLFLTLLTDELSEGVRGVEAIEDRGKFGVGSRIVTQSDTFIVPRTDASGTPISYRLEPFALTVSVSDGATPMPSIPTIPFRFPSGSLTVKILKPGGSVTTIGPAPYVQSRSRELASCCGQTIDAASGHIQDAYQLSTMDPRFEVPFTEDGLHLISLSGTIDDVYGNTWTASGTYPVYVANPLSLDTAVLPGTPFEVGDVFAPGVVVSPPGAAAVQVRVRLMSNSDPNAVEDNIVSGEANNFGYFRPSGNVIKMDQPGEYRVDVTASFTDKYGNLWMGSRTFGSVVAAKNTTIIAHGQRGTDQQENSNPVSTTQWFYRSQTVVKTLPSPDHMRFPFNTGDILWAQRSDAVTVPLSFQDTTGSLLALLKTRPIQGHPELLPLGEAPLYLSRRDGQEPALDPSKVDIWGYGYSSVQRPLVRVREEVLGGLTSSPYWRFVHEFYGGQIGASGDDLTNQFKFQYGGVVLRGSALPAPQYAIYGSLFILVPDNDPLGGSRVFPPFQGNGGGPSGGPLMTLLGRKIDLFFHPTAVRPGSVLETGDTFAMAGAIAPTLPGLVTYNLTTPSGKVLKFSGRANKIGYYYHPSDDFVVTEPGVYTVALNVIYDGITSAGQVSAPFPSGDILGTPNGVFYFYVTPKGSGRLTTNLPETLTVDYVHTGFPLSISVPGNTGHMTATIPGFVLATGQLTGSNGTLTYKYDPRSFSQDFPIAQTPVSNGDLVTISLFDATTNRARIVSFNGWQLMNMEPPASSSVPFTSFSVNDRGGVSLTTTGAAASTTVGYGEVLPAFGSSTPAGLAIFGFRQNGTLVSEAGVPASPAILSGRIYAEMNGSVNTGVAIANPNSQIATVSFYFTDSSGNSGNGVTTIPPNGQIAAFLNQAPFNKSSFTGTFTFVSSIPVAVIALRGFTNQRNEFLITTLPVADLSMTPSATSVIFPHFADGGGWTTQIVLANPTDRTLTGTVQFRDPGGRTANVSAANQGSGSFSYSIPARSAQKFQTTGSAASVIVGSVTVLPDATSVAPFGVAIFSFKNAEVTVSEAGVSTIAPANSFRLSVQASGNFSSAAADSLETGVAIGNPTVTDAVITLELFNPDGSSTGLTGTLSVPAGGQHAAFVNQLPNFTSIPIPFQGVLRISSSTPISVAGLRGHYNDRGDFLLTTTPSMNEATPAPRTPLYFPHLADGGGYTTQFILFSGQAGNNSNGTLQFVSQVGGLLNLAFR